MAQFAQDAIQVFYGAVGPAVETGIDAFHPFLEVRIV
jgi:hypothetical protein